MIAAADVEFRSAIAVHHTDVVDEPWDGPGNEARLRTGESESYYREAYAWQDPDANPETKGAYRFIHHRVSPNGDIGPAVTTACTTGIGVLNGGRGGTTIPDADREGVWRHLAAHLRDAGREPPPLRSQNPRAMESRTIPITELEVRSADGEPPRITGYAAVFEQWSLPLDDWFMAYREKVLPGAFRKTLAESDIRALVNHNPDYVLGRTKAGTLSLAEDDHGLRVEILPPDTQWARDLMVSMRRGDINQMSFGFQVIKDRWTFTDAPDSLDERELLEVRLFDVSVVTFPAYPQTEAWARSMIDALRRYLPPEPPAIGRHSNKRQQGEPVAGGRHSLEILRRRLELKAKAA